MAGQKKISTGNKKVKKKVTRISKKEITRIIDGSTSKSTVDELARRGVKSVKVLDENTINGLILQAVERVTDKRVDHPKGGSSDLAICFVGVHRLVTYGVFDDATTIRRRAATMPEGRGHHISLYNRVPRRLRIGGAIRFGR